MKGAAMTRILDGVKTTLAIANCWVKIQNGCSESLDIRQKQADV
jgi:hypothetical protein